MSTSMGWELSTVCSLVILNTFTTFTLFCNSTLPFFLFFFFFHSFNCRHDSLVSRLPLMFHFLCFHCSSMVPASRNPMWGEEFNFFVDELPVQVDILCSNFIYTSSCDHLHWNIGESLWKSVPDDTVK